MNKLASSKMVGLLVVALMVATGLTGITSAQLPRIPPVVPNLPINESLGGEGCTVPANNNPLSLRNITGFTPGDEHKIFNQNDFDGDGYTNTQEVLARADPTDVRSTPIDRDGDGFNLASDPCDFNAQIPKPVSIEFIAAPAGFTATDTDIIRGESFVAYVLVKVTPKVGDRTPRPAQDAEVEDVKLQVTESDGKQTLTRAPTTMTRVPGAANVGKYLATVTTTASSLAFDPAKVARAEVREDGATADATLGDARWTVNAAAKVVGEAPAFISAGNPPISQPSYLRVTVRPAVFPLAVETWHCPGPTEATCVKVASTDAKRRYFNGENITIRAIPNQAVNFTSAGAGQHTRSAYFTFNFNLVFLGITIPAVKSPESLPRPMDEHQTGGAFDYWTGTIRPSSDNPIATADPALDIAFLAILLNQTTFTITVNATDDAFMPNTAKTTITAQVLYTAEAKVATDDGADVLVRGQTMPIRADYKIDNVRTIGPATGEASIYPFADPVLFIPLSEPVATALLTADPVTKRYKGEYLIKIGDYIDPLSADLDGNFHYWVESEINNATSPAAIFTVNPAVVPVQVDRPTPNEPYTAITIVGSTVTPTMGDIVVKLRLGGAENVDYFNDPARPDPDDTGVPTNDPEQPGRTFVTIFDPHGIPVAQQELVWDGASSPQTFSGSVRLSPDPMVHALIAAANPGIWTASFAYEDDALDIPNFATAEQKFIVTRGAGVSVKIEEPVVTVQDVYGWNNATGVPSQLQNPARVSNNPDSFEDELPPMTRQAGLTGNPAIDRDDILTGDDETTKRFIVATGIARAARIIVFLEGGAHVQSFNRNITSVFVQFDNRTIAGVGGGLPYYEKATVSADPANPLQRKWEMVIDTQNLDRTGTSPLDSIKATKNVNMRFFGSVAAGANDASTPAFGPFPGLSSQASAAVTTQPAVDNARITPMHAASFTRIENDPTGTYTDPSEYLFKFFYRGPTKVLDAGVRVPKITGGTHDVFTQERDADNASRMIFKQGGPTNPLSVLYKPNLTAVSPPAKVDTLFAEVAFKDCTGDSGKEWCIESAHTTVRSGTQTQLNLGARVAAFLPMTKEDPVNQIWRLDVSHQRNGTSPATAGGFGFRTDNRYWLKFRVWNEDGYQSINLPGISGTVATPTAPVPFGGLLNRCGCGDFGAKGTTEYDINIGAVPGQANPVIQFSTVTPNSTILTISGLSGERPGFRTLGPALPTWRPGAQPIYSGADLLDSQTTRRIMGLIAGDSIVASGVVYPNDVFKGIRAGIDVDEDTVLPTLMGVAPTSLDTDFDAATGAVRWTATFPTAGLREQYNSTTGKGADVRIIKTDFGNLLAPATNTLGIPQRFTTNFMKVPQGLNRVELVVDRNAPPEVTLPQVIVNYRGASPVAVTPVSGSPTVVAGAADFRYVGFDLDGVTGAGVADPRKIDALQVAYSFNTQAPDVEEAPPGPAPQTGINSRQRVGLPVTINVPRCNVASGSGSEAGDICETNVNAVEYYFPLKVGFEPLLVRIKDPADPTSWEIDPLSSSERVFGLETVDQERGGVSLVGERGRVLLSERGYHTLSHHAIEIVLDGQEGEPQPYIGYSNGGELTNGPGALSGRPQLARPSRDVQIAIAVDPGVLWDASGDPANPRFVWRPRDFNEDATNVAEWDIVRCTIAQATAAVPTQPANCPSLYQYRWVGIANAMTPFTIYFVNFGASQGDCDSINAQSGLRSGVSPFGSTYPEPDDAGNCGGSGNDHYVDDDTRDDFDAEFDTGPKADFDRESVESFEIPRVFIWDPTTLLPLPTPTPPGTTSRAFSGVLVTQFPFADLELPKIITCPSCPNGVRVDPARDMILKDGPYTATARGIDGVETGSASGFANDDGPYFDFNFIVRNDNDTDGWSDALENKIRDQIRTPFAHRQFPSPGGYYTFANYSNPRGLPLANGHTTFVHPTLGHQQVDAAKSTPCDWDGDGFPNDFNCLGAPGLDFEQAFHMNPFVFDTPFDDPNGNGVPNFLDITQTYRFDCTDNDNDGWCLEDEEEFGSSDDNPRSVPGDVDGDGIPDDIEKNPILGTPLQTVQARECVGPTPACPHLLQINVTAGAPVKYVFVDAFASPAIADPLNSRVEFTLGIHDGAGEKDLVTFESVGSTLDAARQMAAAATCNQQMASKCPHFFQANTTASEHVYVDLKPDGTGTSVSVGVHDAGGQHRELVGTSSIAGAVGLVSGLVGGTACIKATNATCPHAIMVNLPPGSGFKHAYVDASTAGTFEVGLHNDAGQHVVIANQATVTGAVGIVLGILLGVVGTASDADGDGYSNAQEVLAFSNPLHRNSRPNHKGGGFPGDYDGDGYSDAQEVIGGSDPIRECSTPRSPNGGIRPGSPC